MLSYTMIGSNDLVAAGRFYSSIVIPLGPKWKDEISNCVTRSQASMITRMVQAAFM